MLIVADVQYAHMSPSIPSVNIWCAHTTNHSNSVAIMAKIIPWFPNAFFFFSFMTHDV